MAAETLAHDAARAAGIRVTAVAESGDLDHLRRVMDQIWGAEIVPPRNLLRGLALAGAALLVAHRTNDVDGDHPIGFALGWLGWAGGIHFHSHQTGVLATERSGGVGFALKLAQRALCLRHGITEMRWTFDPLLASNAVFNLNRLGAGVIGFMPNCYGERTDAFNTGDVTDRVEVSWRLDRPVGAGAPTGNPNAEQMVIVDDAGRPMRHSTPACAGAVIAIPNGYHGLRHTDPVAGGAWRLAVGTALTDVFDGGLGIAGLTVEQGVCAYVAGAASREVSRRS